MKFLLHLFFIGVFVLDSFGQNVVFERFTTRDGLSQNDVLAISQDSEGFMWFGTNDGLNRYDGYHFEVFRGNKNDSNSIQSNLISSITEDYDKNLVIGFINKGISIYNLKTGIFTGISNSKQKPDLLTSNFAARASILHDGRIWIGSDHGINFLTKQKDGSYTNVKVNENSESSFILPKRNYYFIDEISDSMAWVSPGDRLYLLKSDTTNDAKYTIAKRITISSIFNIRRVMPYKNGFLIAHNKGIDFLLIDLGHPDNYTYEHLSDYNSTALAIDKAGDLWTGGSNGVQRLKPTGDLLRPFKIDQVFTVGPNENNISNKYIRSLFVDRSGIVWIGTNGSGICKYNPSKRHFRQYAHTAIEGSISNNKVTDIYEDKNRNIWFGTEGGGLNLLPHEKQKQYANGFVSFDVNSINNQNFVYDLVDISRNNKMEYLAGIGFASNFVAIENVNHKWTVSPSPFPIPKSVFTLCKDSEGNVWAGTYNDGLYKYNPNLSSSEVIHLTKDNSQLPSDIIRKIIEDSKGRIWIGTADGLCVIPKIERQKPNPPMFIYRNNPEDNNSLIDNYVIPIFETSKGQIWIGTLGGGLNKYIEGSRLEDGKFQRFTTENGMPSNVIKDIVEDLRGDLWISSNKGLTKLNPVNNNIHNFGIQDGIQDYEFGDNAGCVLHDGEILFGGVNGFNAFYPDEITLDTIPSTTVFTQLEINNKPIKVGERVNGKVILDVSINIIKQITLGHNENNFTIHFAALHFSVPNSNRYKYRLNGYDKEWITTSSNNRFAKYTNLAEGNYTFEVLTANSDDVWSRQIKSLKIKIVPPYWQTWWFKITVFLFLASISIIYFRMRIKEVKNRNLELEKTIELRTAEIRSKNTLLEDQTEQLRVNNLELNEVIKTKDKFVSIIAHDIINPFNSIIGFSDILLNEAETLNEKDKLEYIGYINESSTGLFNLLKNLLQWSRSQRGLIDYVPEKLELDELIEAAISVYESSAKVKNIQLINSNGNKVEVLTDRNMINAIIRNIISNAIKFTPEGGKITIHTKLEKQFILVSITDSGRGMSKTDIEKLFRLDIQHTTLGTNNEKGTGLGLILIKEFVEKQGGKLYVESEPGIGSSFSFSILLA